MARKKRDPNRPIESYEHRDKERLNNPPAGLVTPETDPDAGQQKKTYAYDPHLDPQLVWAGKAEHASFETPTVSLHVHERIDPRTIIETVRKSPSPPPSPGGRGWREAPGEGFQLPLFELERQEPLREAVEFYRHKHGWSNRLIAGDSLLVMNSLLEKEGMAGKVQMVYIDPPYGIRYGSNFQPFVNKRDVKDGKDEDLTAEPEQIKAFRDTWELGIHSYLTHLRDRLLLARELLTESGSIFVQISDENVHRVRCLMDEVFGAENFVSQIAFMTTTGRASEYLDNVFDVALWYAKDTRKTKYRQLFSCRTDEMLTERYKYIDEDKRYRLSGITSQGKTEGETSQPFVFQGKQYWPSANRHWSATANGLRRLVKANRITLEGSALVYKRYNSDFPLFPLRNVWTDTGGGALVVEKMYVVQTASKIIQRCLLMTTDPGDLVFDPTCGSSTTAYVAEQWGQRWITCDTSRVALTLARQRLMTAVFDYYELAHPEEGVGSGFKYKTVPHVTLKSIANNPEIDSIYTRMHPAIETALAELNRALKGHKVKFKVMTGGRAGQLVDFAASDEATFTMPSGQVVKVNELVEWEVPSSFELFVSSLEWPEGMPEQAGDFAAQLKTENSKLKTAFEAFHTARRTLQQAINAAIARHAPQETLYDQPFVERKKVRVSGPFTVEAVPAPVVKSPDEILEATPQPADAPIARSGETLRQGEWRDELLRTGIRGKFGQYIRFARLEPLPGCRWLHADGETRPSDEGADRVRETGPAYTPLHIVVSFGPEHGPLEQRQVAQAIEEAQTLAAKPKLIVFAAFQFDPEAAKDIDETNWPGVTLLKAQMNADLLTDDLKKKRASNESFWLIGQPDVRVERIAKGEDKGKYRVSVHGFDYYNTKTGGIESGGEDKIAVWLLDTDDDGRSLYPRQVFFPMAGKNEGWARLAKTLKAEIDEERIEVYRGTVSLPFEPGEHRRIAVKIVDDRGIESLKVLDLTD